jgi:hypothetical protein
MIRDLRKKKLKRNESFSVQCVWSPVVGRRQAIW